MVARSGAVGGWGVGENEGKRELSDVFFTVFPENLG